MAQEDRFLTVIVPQGKGAALLRLLNERGVDRASLGTARAPLVATTKVVGISRTVHLSVEKDILTAVVPGERAEEVFGLVHEAAEIADEPGGFMFMGRVSKASPFSLPTDLPHS